MVVGLIIGGIALVGAGAASALSQDEAQREQADVGGRTIDAYEIYQKIQGGQGPGSLMTAKYSADTLKGKYDARVAQIESLDKKMESAWTGKGGEGARRGAEPLKRWMEDSRSKLDTASTALDDQYGAFTTVSGKVREIPRTPPESGFLNDINPLETDLDQKIQQYNNDAQTNVDAFNQYFHSSTNNARQMPNYSTMEGDYGNVDVQTKPGAGGGPGDGGGPGGGGPGGYGAGGSYSGGGAGGSYSPSAIPAASYSPPGGGGGGYNSGAIPGNVAPPGSSYTPPEYTSPDYNGPEFDDGSTSSAGYTAPSYNLPGTGGFGPGSGGFGPTGSGSGSYGAGSYGAGGGAYGAGGFGPRGSGLSGGASTGSAVPGSGSTTGGYSGARTGSTGSSSSMGRPMMGGMGGGGRGQGGEDEEHERKYLIEEDGNSLFGTDELTAPPVIGE